MNKPICLGLSILELRKTEMCKFCFDYFKLKYQDKGNLCYMDTNNFILNIKTEDVYKDIANDFEKRFDTSNYETEGPLQISKNKKLVELMKDELGRKIMTKFAGLRPKAYSYLIQDSGRVKKANRRKKCIIKQKLQFDDYKKDLQNNKIILR